MRPHRAEISRRHFFLLEPGREQLRPGVPGRWAAGEGFPSDGGLAQRWTCRWLPLVDARGLSGGFARAVGRIFT